MKIFLIIIGAVGFLLLAVVLLTSVGSYQFNQAVNREVQAFYRDVENEHEIVTEADLAGLPAPVQTWLRKAQVLGKEKIVAARTEQDVQLRLDKDQPWMPARAEQYFRTEAPGFIWKVKSNAALLFHIAGRDKYQDGRGYMQIKLMSLFPVADASGPEIDQGALLRYLAESIWLPTVALNEYIRWEQIDALSAKATMDYMGVSASGIFTFNDQGEIVKFEAKRYGEFGGEYQLEPWVVEVSDYKEFGGFMIPSTGKITWQLETGDFEWYRVTVKEMEYNPEVNRAYDKQGSE